MKTLTVTFHHTTNYGAVLQTYALQQSICAFGHENVVLETISYPKKCKKNMSLRSLLRNLFFKISYLYRKTEVERLKQFFVDFHKTKLNLTRPYATMDELRNDNIDADCLITGSDQVWNFKTTPEFLDARLLCFGKPNAHRFSYAASMKCIDFSDSEKEKLKKALSFFSGISLREENVKIFIENIIQKNCIRVLDPVFLLSQEKWNQIAKEPRYKGNYILCYQVVNNKTLPKFAKKLSKQTGLPIISVCNGSFRWFNADYSFFDVSIEEFLGFYKNASYILSASFHGVAMGLVYEKPVFLLVF